MLGAVALTVLAGVMVLDDRADAAVGTDPTGPLPKDYVYEGLIINQVDYKYSTAEVTRYAEEPVGELVIPFRVTNSSDGGTFIIVAIADNAFMDCMGITSVTIPDSVTSIGLGAFQSCSGLASVTFESEVVPTFGSNAFSTGTTIYVSTPGWDPVAALADAHDTDTTIVWANPPYSDLEFTSDPIADGIYAYVGPKPLETN